MSWFKKFIKLLKDLISSNSGQNNDPTNDPVDDPTSDPVDNPVVGADEVPFKDLVWSYGGFKGGGAVAIPEAVIKNLTFKGNTLYYGWVKGGCENFGAKGKHDADYTICAVFFKDASGKYVGGKFDWISSDRLSRGILTKKTITDKILKFIGRKRGLENIHGGYSGWNTTNVPNPADAAFVICGVSSPGGGGSSGKRTNVIKGVWSR